MKKVISFVIAIVVFTGVFYGTMAVNASSDVTMFFVDASHSGVCEGTKQSPFKTVQQALDASESVSGTTVINLREGDYSAETLKLDDKNNNLIIRAYPGEKVSLSGGVKIKLSSLKDITDEAVINRFTDKSVSEKIKTINLVNDCGIEDVGGLEPQGYNVGIDKGGYGSHLSYKDEYLPVSEYPNGGFLVIPSNVYEQSNSTPLTWTKGITNFYPYETLLNESNGDSFDRYKNWENAEDLWTTGYVSETWADVTAPAKADFSDGRITLYSDNRLLEGCRVKFINLLEEIDSPGEWFLNKNTGELYVYPPEDMSDSDEFYFNSYNEKFIDISGASNVTISGIRFAGTKNNAISANGASGIIIDNCEFTNIGDAVIKFEGCTKSGIKNSYIHDVGSAGVHFSNCGDKETLTKSDCFVENCEIKAFQQYKKTYASGVQADDCVGISITNNEIHDASHFAVYYRGCYVAIRKNKFYDVCKETADAGTIYAGKRWDNKGNVIEYNYFEGIIDNGVSGHAINGVYLDDGHSSTKVNGNIFYKMPQAALIAGGRDNVFTNNIMIECNNTLSYESRGTEWKNILDVSLGTSDPAYWISDEWREQFPELKLLLKDFLETAYGKGLLNVDYYAEVVEYIYGDKTGTPDEALKNALDGLLSSKLRFNENGVQIVDTDDSNTLRTTVGLPKNAVISDNAIIYSLAGQSSLNVHDNVKSNIKSGYQYEDAISVTKSNAGGYFNNYGTDFTLTDDGKTDLGIEDSIAFGEIGLRDSNADCNISFDISGNDGLSYTATVNSLSDNGSMEKGWADIRIIAPEGYRIKYFDFGGIVKDNVNEEALLELIMLQDNSATLKVVFEKLPDVSPVIIIEDTPSVGVYAGNQPNYMDAEGFPVSVFGYYNSVLCYGKIPAYTKDVYNITVSGISITNENGESVDLSIESSCITDDGRFGLRIFGAALMPGRYTLTPYVKYSTNGAGETAYKGEEKTATIS